MGITAAIASIAAVGAGGMALGSSMAQKPSAPPAPPPTVSPDATNTMEANAQAAAAKRRRMYANMGRSSTILTGPGGLDNAPPANSTEPKMLLGL